MERLVKALKEKKLTISSCESLTGGMFASDIVSISGASSVFKGAFVTYMDECKEVLLDGKDILNAHGAISEEMAYKMACVVKSKLNTNIAVSFTGNAGPLASENKEVGLVYSCIIIDELILNYKDIYSGDRTEIRKKCIIDAIDRILENL